MSAGGLSYSGITNYGKATLPSVESWGTNMNILRDPPKSITTRRIDKVGETSDITSMIDDSGDRFCEAIQVYARGVNPMVSVSYSNMGNNGGQRSGGLKVGGQTQARLPYTVNNDGAFRPPVRRQEDLLPLSRMPRVWTTAFSQPGFSDFSKKIKSCGTAETTKEVKNSLMNVCARPTAVYQIETPLVEPFEVKYVIQPTIKTSGHSGIRTMDHTSQFVQEPTKEVNYNNMHAFVSSNLTDNKYVNNSEMNPERYLQDPVHNSAATNLGKNIHKLVSHDKDIELKRTMPEHSAHTNIGAEYLQFNSLEDVIDMTDVKVKDLRNVSYQAPKSGNEKVTYLNDKIELKRSMPEHSARTNIGKNIHKVISHEKERELERNTPLTSFSINPVSKGNNIDISSREYNLAPKINAGGFSGRGSVPMQNRMQNVREDQESEKSLMLRKVSEQHQGRYTH